MANATLPETIPQDNAALSAESLPLFVYRDKPVVTSAILAQMYETDPKCIRENYRANRDRFTEGKHFFKVDGKEYKQLREYARNTGSLGISVYMPRGGNSLMLWTERGAARHAKITNTDKAWDIFEVMEESYFNRTADAAPTVTPAPTIDTGRLTTAKERNALTGLVNRYVGQLPSGPHQEAYKAAWRKVHDVMGIKSIEELTVEQLPRAVLFMQTMVEGKTALSTTEATALPAAPTRNTLGDYKGIYKDLPETPLIFSTLTTRMAEATDRYSRELEAIREEATRPYRINRKSDVQTYFDGALTPTYSLFNAARDSIRFTYNMTYDALEGCRDAWLLLNKG